MSKLVSVFSLVLLLNVLCACGSEEDELRVLASFTAEAVEGKDYTIQFTNTSVNGESFAWDFDNDGDIDSTEENPEWDFVTTGVYHTVLTATGTDGSDSVMSVMTVKELTPIADIVWKNWYLSVPLNNGGKAMSIYYQEIESDNLSNAASEYFYKNSDGSFTMYTKFTGYHTSGTAGLDAGKYCRTELREYWQGIQDTDDNWSMGTGTHILESTLKVEHCGDNDNERTYVAQIHGKETTGLEGSPATVKVQWDDGDIIIEYYEKPKDGEKWSSTYDEKINIGTVNKDKFTIKIKIEEGKLYYGLVCEATNLDKDYIFVYDYVGNGYGHDNYFKTGNYFKHNKDYTQSSQVVLYAAKTIHE